jgi:poly-gamma-glutamate synthesis protein (capsule biosynthesis protein)
MVYTYMLRNIFFFALVTILLTGCVRGSEGTSPVNDFIVDTEAAVSALEEMVPRGPTGELRLLASGDLMLARHVGRTMHAEGIDYPFRRIPLVGRERFFHYNEFLVNLEGSINGYDDKCRGCFSFSFADEVAPMLSAHGVTLASLANNHSLDRGEKGYQRTRTLLEEAGITPFGKLYTVSDEVSVTYRVYEDLRVAYLGLAVFGDFPEDRAVELIRAAGEQSDRVIVTVHWGVEYKHQPNTLQRRLAHTWIEAGADAIIGHHPHVIQSVEVHKDAPIFYSLGNFVFDQYFSDAVQQGLLLGLTMDHGGWEARLYPIRSKRAQPALADEKEWVEQLRWLGENSPGLDDVRVKSLGEEGVLYSVE